MTPTSPVSREDVVLEGLAAMLPKGACGVLGLCERAAGHEGKHETSVGRAIAAFPSEAASRAVTETPEGLAEADIDAAEESRKYVGLRSKWWLDGARWALERWRRATTENLRT